MSKSIFVSYTRTDQHSFIAELAHDISLFDCAVWYDKALENKGGQQWWDIICEEIRNCDVFIYVATDDYFQSIPCQSELKYATELKKQRLPIYLRDSLDFSNVPTIYQQDNFLEFVAGTKDHQRNFRDTLRDIPESPLLPEQLPPQPPVPVHPATALKERLASLELDFGRQKQLLWDIETTINNSKYRADAIQVLEQFYSLERILVVEVWKEAGELLQKHQKGHKRVSVESAKIDRPEVGAKAASNPDSGLSEMFANILGNPFSLIEIPPGVVSVAIRTNNGVLVQKIEIPGFAIGRYPITNAQFKKFVDAQDGYKNPKLWGYSPNSDEWFHSFRKPAPIAFRGDNKPRTNLSWYEANVFCIWLQNITEKKVTLPDEYQWQHAGQATLHGKDKRRYPWGDEFYKTRCRFNTEEPENVTEHENGQSELGVMGLSGNIWEWCTLSKIKGAQAESNRVFGRSLTNSYKVYGGSFKSVDPDDLTLESSERAEASQRLDNVGFRIIVEFQ